MVPWCTAWQEVWAVLVRFTTTDVFLVSCNVPPYRATFPTCRWAGLLVFAVYDRVPHVGWHDL